MTHLELLRELTGWPLRMRTDGEVLRDIETYASKGLVALVVIGVILDSKFHPGGLTEMLQLLRRLFCRHRNMKFSVHAVSGALAVVATCSCGSAWGGTPADNCTRLPSSPVEAPAENEDPIDDPPPDPQTPPTLEDIITHAAHDASIPPEFMLALAYKESRMNPDYELEKEIDVETSRLPSGKKDTYWGLFQVGHKSVLPDYNERKGTHFEKEDLFDPDVNAAIAADAINRIATAYSGYAAKHGISALRENWRGVEYTLLVVAGWNSGWSRGGGVQKVALWLHDKGLPVTHDNVFKHAARAGATKFLDIARYRTKYDWQREVVNRYFATLRAPKGNS